MARPRFRLRLRLWPDTVVGRTAMVLVAALAVSLAAALWLFAGHRHEALAAIGGRNAAERVAGLVQMAEQAPTAFRRQALRNLDTPGFRVGWGTLPIVAEPETDGLAGFVVKVLDKAMAGREVRVATATLPPGGVGKGMMHGQSFTSGLRISVRLDDGSWLNVAAPLERGDPLWRPRFVLPLMLALLLVTGVALWAVRRATRPFATFAAAAGRLGIDVTAPPLAEDGPREVRQAASAFNVMQGRIRRFVEDRTQMLAAISHDLKTPITRLRLRAEFVEDEEQRTKMLADLAEMESMIASTLAFARDDAAREPRVRVDLAALVQGLVDDTASTGGAASYAGPERLVMEARPSACKRALANLIDNAVKYGGCARVTLAESPADVVVTVDDDGPGIPVPDHERVFAPFVRLDSSRSRDTGGTGLGLAVARAAVRAHGGDIRLENREEGGLRVVVGLPKG